MARKMHRTTRLKITELNPHLMCALCGGYLVNASTIVECLHSFCKTCIVKFLQTSKFCPLCDAMIHKTKPLSNVRPDKTLQNLVYKLVPNLFKSEMQKRRCFFAQNPTADTSWISNEDRGEVDEDKMMIYTEDDQISLSLEYSDIGKPEPEVQPPPPPVSEAPSSPNLSDDLNTNHKRYLLCPAGVTVSHLKKFIRMKFDLPLKLKITIFHTEEPLNEEFTLMDVAYIYAWRRRGPLRLFYNVCENKQKKRTICADSVDSLVTTKTAAIGSTNGEISGGLSSKGKHGKSIDESFNSSMRSTPDSHASVVTSVRDS